MGKIRHQLHLPLTRLISAWLRADKVAVGPCCPLLTSSSRLKVPSRTELWLLMFDSMARWLRKAAKEQSDSNSIEVANVPAKIMVVDLLSLVTSPNGIAMMATVTAIEAVVVGFVTAVITTTFARIVHLSLVAVVVKQSVEHPIAVPALSCEVTS